MMTECVPAERLPAGTDWPGALSATEIMAGYRAQGVHAARRHR